MKYTLRDNALILQISGKQGAGKSTTAHLISNYISQREGIYARVFKYADKIYKVHNVIRDCMREDYDDIPDLDPELLQLIGTEYGRRIDKLIWIRITLREITRWFESQGTFPSVAIIDDLRFVNEFHMNYPYVLNVRLECDRDLRKARAEKWRDRENHPSEIELDRYAAEGKFDLLFDSGNMRQIEIAHRIYKAILARL